MIHCQQYDTVLSTLTKIFVFVVWSVIVNGHVIVTERRNPLLGEGIKINASFIEGSHINKCIHNYIHIDMFK